MSVSPARPSVQRLFCKTSDPSCCFPRSIFLAPLPTSPVGVPCRRPSFFWHFLFAPCSGPPSYLCSPRLTEIICLMLGGVSSTTPYSCVSFLSPPLMREDVCDVQCHTLVYSQHGEGRRGDSDSGTRPNVTSCISLSLMLRRELFHVLVDAVVTSCCLCELHQQRVFSVFTVLSLSPVLSHFILLLSSLPYYSDVLTA